MARNHQTISCCRIKGRKSGLCSCVLIRGGNDWQMDCLPLHPTSSPRGVEWKWMTLPTFALLLWSWRSRDAGLQMECTWSYCLLRKMMEDVFFFPRPLLLWLTAGLLCNAARERGLLFDDTFSFLFYFLHRDDWGILCMRVCAFLLQDTDAVDGSDGEWDVDTTLEHPSLSPSRWPFRLKTLPRGWYCGSPLHLHHRSVTDCKKRNILLL